MKPEIINKIKQLFLIEEKDIKNIYIFGSSVYKNNKNNSDIDLLVIVDNKYDKLNCQEKKNGKYDFHLNTEKEYIKNLEDHHIKYLECYFSNNEFKLNPDSYKLKIDLGKLRHSVSKISNNSWSKANKKINLSNEDTYIGFKSLFHCLRIVDFGIQIAKEKQITNFNSSNYLWDEIYLEFCCKTDWESMKDKYKPLYNSLMTEFRKYAPKDK